MAPVRIAPGPDLLDDLCTRFILNVPASELESFEKFMFLVEQAHWFYEDFCREKEPQLKSLSLKEFTSLLFGHCPGLAPFKFMLDDIYNNFNKFKQSVPTMGAILLDPTMEKVLLVRGLQPSHGWGFPKGKVAKDESDHDCAIREVREETGLDVTQMLRKDDFIEVHLGMRGDDGLKQQRCRLFIIRGVDESTCFCPTVKGEIGGFGWHMVDELPATSEATKQIFLNAAGGRHRFHLVYPFVKQLRAWIKMRRRQEQQVHQSNGTRQQKPGSGKATVNGKHSPAADPQLSGSWNGETVKPKAPRRNGEAVKPEIKRLQMPTEPGQAWINFCFKEEEVMRHLTWQPMRQRRQTSS